MIGVICKSEETATVEEFFQLFKTPWEYYEPAQTYDVVLMTADESPIVDAKLLVVYGAETKNGDAGDSIALRTTSRRGTLNYLGAAVPIYGNLATFQATDKGMPCLDATVGVAGVRFVSTTGQRVLRFGYDLFQEVQRLFTAGQPIEYAHVPSLDIHISILRDGILREGISLPEIPPSPPNHTFVVCLTHDIDFVGIRNHKFDHTMFGFLYRSTIGAVRNLFRRRISIRRLLETWRAAASLPFVYLGWAKDFWSPFEWYLRVEKDLAATYFLIPFRKRMGDNVPGKHAVRRAASYDVEDIRDWTAILQREGCELGVHGIDAWHSVEKGQTEYAKLARVKNESSSGIRMHWLLQDQNTPSVLEKAGYAYDSTAGFNDTVGYRNGTTQVFRPLGVKTLLELPMHIQDGALFYQNKLDLHETEAEKRCKDLIENAGKFGGVLTVLWHDRSHGPERFWGDFYVSLVAVLKSSDAWFATGSQAVDWFRKRREVRFERFGNGQIVRAILERGEKDSLPPLCIRVHQPGNRNGGQCSNDEENTFTDVSWNSKAIFEFDSSSQKVAELPIKLSVHGIR